MTVKDVSKHLPVDPFFLGVLVVWFLASVRNIVPRGTSQQGGIIIFGVSRVLDNITEPTATAVLVLKVFSLRFGRSKTWPSGSFEARLGVAWCNLKWTLSSLGENIGGLACSFRLCQWSTAELVIWGFCSGIDLAGFQLRPVWVRTLMISLHGRVSNQ